jgi:hypothetical protein
VSGREAREAYEDRICAPLERRIAMLEAALRSIASNTCCSPCQEAALVAQAALAGAPKSAPHSDQAVWSAWRCGCHCHEASAHPANADRERAQRMLERYRSCMDESFCDPWNTLAAMVASEFAAVRAEERERCAKACETEGRPHTWASENADVYAEYERVCLNCAAAIRALRGQE